MVYEEELKSNRLKRCAMYHFLDHFFLVFHTLIVLFNLTGWISAKTRRLHLIIIGTTLCSWFLLGIWYGWGYCPCTDWHWEVKRALGERDLPASYVKYYLDRLTGIDWRPRVVDIIVLIFGLGAFIVSIVSNLQDVRKKKKESRNRGNE